MCARIFVLILFALEQCLAIPTTQTVMIGAMLSSVEEQKDLEDIMAYLNKETSFTNSLPRYHDLNITSIVMDNNPIQSALTVCEDLIPKQVYAVISSHTKDLYLSSVSVSYTCGFYRIPVIGIAARESIFSDKNVHKSYLRTLPPYSHQAYVWADLIENYEWKEVIVLTTSDQDGRSILNLLRRTVEDHDIYKFKIEKAIQFKAGETNMTSYLMQAKQCQSTVLLLYAGEQDAANVYEAAERLNMTRAGYVWIVTEQGITGDALAMAPEGLLGIRLNGSMNMTAHMIDALKVVAKGLHSYTQIEEQHKPPKHCRDDKPWVAGDQFYKKLIDVVSQKGPTEIDIQFDSSGNMIAADYTILNMHKRHLVPVGNWKLIDVVSQKGPTEIDIQFDSSGDMIAADYTILNMHKRHLVPVGNWSATTGVEMKSSILWPGSIYQQPEGFEIPTYLRVVSIKSHPFVYVNDPPEPPYEDEEKMMLYEENPCGTNQDDDEIVIPCVDHTDELKCCTGFCMELLNQLSENLNFTYDVHLVDDNNYGSYERINGTTKRWTGLIGEVIEGKSDIIVAPLTINQERSKVIDFSKPFKYQGLAILIKRINGTTKRWTGLVGNLVDGKADMVVAPLSINQERSVVIDFTKPFKYQGLSIIIKRPSTQSFLLQFLRPFEPKLWILILACIHFVAVMLYLLDRFSPFSRPKTDNLDEPDACNISQAIWFSWSVIMNSGIGDGTPRSFAARVLGVVWAGFAMIIVGSYTAYLAAYLVLDKPKGGITGIDDARIRNPSASFKYATVAKSSVETYFRRQVELSSMYMFMKDQNYKNAEDAIDALKRDEIQAFIWDSAMLDYEAARDCSLVTVGELFGRSGFGIGLSKDSPWTSKISLEILSSHEKGFMEKIDTKWIRKTICKITSNQPRTLEMSSMGGVFILVAGGLAISCFSIWVEILYKRKMDAKQRHLDLARVAVAQWRGTVKVRNTSVSKEQEEEEECEDKMTNQVSAGPTAGKHNGVQGLAALEEEMDGTMPVSMLSRRHRNRIPTSSRMNHAGYSNMQAAKAIYHGDIEMKERV